LADCRGAASGTVVFDKHFEIAGFKLLR